MKFVDFCLDIGGGRLALEKLGLECVAYTRRSIGTQNTYDIFLNKKYEEQEIASIEDVNPEEIPNFSFMLAEIPVERFKSAAKNEYSMQFSETFDSIINILKIKKASYFLFETVPMNISIEKEKRFLEDTNKKLESLGYKVNYQILNSLKYGVPHKKRRLYFVGIREDLLKEGEKWFSWPKEVEKPDLKDYLIDSHNELSEYKINSLKDYLNNEYNRDEYTLEEILSEEYLILDVSKKIIRVSRGNIEKLDSIYSRNGIYYVREGKLRELTEYEALLLQGFSSEQADLLINSESWKYEERLYKLKNQACRSMVIPLIHSLAEQLLLSSKETITDKLDLFVYILQEKRITKSEVLEKFNINPRTFDRYVLSLIEKKLIIKIKNDHFADPEFIVNWKHLNLQA